MKLRTLKDLENLDLPDRDKIVYGFSEILREEAKKWIKEIEEVTKHPNNTLVMKMDGRMMLKLDREAMTDWITSFFNLEEEDE